MKMKCTGPVYVSGHGIVNENEIVEIEESELEDPRIAAHFRPVDEVGDVPHGEMAAQDLPGMFDDGTASQKRRTRR